VASSNSKKGSGDQELIELQRALLSGPTTDLPQAEPDQDVTRAFMERRAAQREAYGQFVAAGDIYDPMGNSKVFTAGMQVPMEHVEKWDLEATGMVTRVATAEEARRGFAVPDIGPGTLLGDSAPAPTSASSSTSIK
jgi:hypothetical protein